MTNNPSPVGTARARLGNAVRFHGRNSAEAREAFRVLLAAKLAAKQAEADEMAAQLAAYDAMTVRAGAQALIRLASEAAAS